MPVAGSALPGGHSPRVGFFLVAHPPASDEVALLPLVCADEAEMVEVVELVEAMDEEEFWRWMVLRGPVVNILLTSSEFMAPKLLPLDDQPPIRVLGWKLSGGATAVI
jgi:hypothetical protein